ncbi:MAG: hypothetical protein ACFHX7_03080 [Pseudomonadota bacterium]
MKGLIDNAKLITCILPKGKAILIQRALVEEAGIHGVNFHRARGVGRFSPLSKRGIGEQQEKEILEVCVPAEEADVLFERIFFAGEMDRPHGGIIYMTSLSLGMALAMPEIPQAQPGD